LAEYKEVGNIFVGEYCTNKKDAEQSVSKVVISDRDVLDFYIYNTHSISLDCKDNVNTILLESIDNVNNISVDNINKLENINNLNNIDSLLLDNIENIDNIDNIQPSSRISSNDSFISLSSTMTSSSNINYKGKLLELLQKYSPKYHIKFETSQTSTVNHHHQFITTIILGDFNINNNIFKGIYLIIFSI
jgi:hypothetical protein